MVLAEWSTSTRERHANAPCGAPRNHDHYAMANQGRVRTRPRIRLLGQRSRGERTSFHERRIISRNVRRLAIRARRNVRFFERSAESRPFAVPARRAQRTRGIPHVFPSTDIRRVLSPKGALLRTSSRDTLTTRERKRSPCVNVTRSRIALRRRVQCTHNRAMRRPEVSS